MVSTKMRKLLFMVFLHVVVCAPEESQKHDTINNTVMKSDVKLDSEAFLAWKIVDKDALVSIRLNNNNDWIFLGFTENIYSEVTELTDAFMLIEQPSGMIVKVSG